MLLIALPGVAISSYSQTVTPKFLWARNVQEAITRYLPSAPGTCPALSTVSSIAAGTAGEIYVAGTFWPENRCEFDVPLTEFLAKFDSAGNALWFRDTGMRITIATDRGGNIYGAGQMYDWMAGSASDVAVKFDSAGNLLWASPIGEDGRIAVDALTNVYVSGYFQSPTVLIGNVTLTNAGMGNLFTAKYDADGNLLWARSAGGNSYDAAHGVAADATGNVYVTGLFSSTNAVFGAVTLTNLSITEMFVAKYSPDGNVIWAKSAGGNDEDSSDAIAVDAVGNAYVTGHFFSSNATFGTVTLTNAGSSLGYPPSDDMFVAKYDPVGNVLWAKSAGGGSRDYGSAIATDAAGNAYVTGLFCSPSISFGSTTLTNSWNGNLFVAKYNSSGNVQWAKGAGLGSESVTLAIDQARNVFVAGNFLATLPLDSVTLTNANGAQNAFLTKIGFEPPVPNGDTHQRRNRLHLDRRSRPELSGSVLRKPSWRELVRPRHPHRGD